MSLLLAERLQGHLEALADQTAARLVLVWSSAVRTPDAEGAWVAGARPILAASAERAVGLSGAYARALRPGATLAPVSSLIVPAATATVWDPLAVTWGRLAAGDDWATATTTATVTVSSIGEDAAMTPGRDATADLIADTYTAYGRRLNAGACKWCMSMASYTWPTAHEASFGHSRCRCTPVPVDDLGDHNDTVTTAAGWDRQAEKAYRKRHQVARLRESEDIAKRRSREAAEQLRIERDPDRRERLSQREQDWETRAERAAEKRRILETGTHRLAA